MRKVHFIAMDTHGQTTDICVKTRVEQPGKRYHVATTIPHLRAVLEGVPRPRKLTFEEGPLADWLWRNLQGSVEEALVSDPRRNALIAKDGDKDDPIDAGKLCDLYLGGYLRAVHHPASLARQLCKQTVGLYHERVRERVRTANKIIGLCKRWGLIVWESDFAEAAARPAVLARLGSGAGQEVVQGHVALLWRSYDEAVAAEEQLRRELVKLGRAEPQVVRWQNLPGIAWVRGTTLLAYLDTPWRFKSKQALWKYLGIGLVRARSGAGPEVVRVERHVNRVLKNVIVGAAQTAIAKGNNPFAEQYRRWLAAGLSQRNARRNVARSLAGVLWGMWKTGRDYDPAQVGVLPAGVG
jgi:transposase